MLVQQTIALGLVLLAAAPASAQDSTRAEPRDTLVLAHEFTGPRSEFVRVTLEAGQAYRVEVTGASELRVRALKSGVQQPLLTRTEAMARASHTISFELRPYATEVYELRVSGIRDGSAPVKIYWDATGSAQRKPKPGN